MGKLTWDEVGKRFYETGVDHGVLYPVVGSTYSTGVVWDGLSSINESPSGGEETAIYADNIKYLSMMSNEDFGLTIEAYQSPEEFDECDGTAEITTGIKIEQQSRRSFGLSYRTLIGNDTEDKDYGYKIHLVYGGKAQPSEKSRSTVNDSPEATTMSWEVKTTPVTIKAVNPKTGKPYKPTSHLTIDSTTVSQAVLSRLEDVLYGTDDVYSLTGDTAFETDKQYYELVNGEYVLTTDPAFDSSKTYYEKTAEATAPRLPLPDEVIKIINEAG